MSSLETAQGQSAVITMSMGAAMIDDATIVVTDIPASNGIIHVIDAVIRPGM